MYYAFDTYYLADKAHTVGIGFDSWASTAHSAFYQVETDVSADHEYVSGQFYKRELPCILNLLEQIPLQPGDVLIVDGFVVLDDSGAHGLGGHLYEHLGRQYPVIGVAKRNFASLHQLKRAVLRGKSATPLFITALGIDLDIAAAAVESMHGPYRMPDLLKKLDILSRSVTASPAPPSSATS